MSEEQSERPGIDEPEPGDSNAEEPTASGRARADDVAEKLKQEEDAGE